MLLKRIIPCLDVMDGKVVKGRSFESLQYAGDAIGLAKKYYDGGADEIVFLDITATNEKRKTECALASAVSNDVFVPFCVGGGIGSFEDASAILEAGADKVALNTAVLKRPALIGEIGQSYGAQAVVVAVDAKKEGEGWAVYSNAGKKRAGKDAVAWALEAEGAGAGEILLTSMDNDGGKNGYDLALTKAVSDAAGIPVIASGGAGSANDIAEAFTKGNADAALLAGILHYGKTTVMKIKKELAARGIAVRLG